MQRSIPFLWGVVIILLVVSLTLIFILNLARLMAIESLTKLEGTLDRLANEVIIYDLEINRAIPLDVVVPTDFGQTLEVDTVVELNTTIPVEIEISQTQLAGYLHQGKHDVARLKSYLALQGGVIVETPIVTTQQNEAGLASPGAVNVETQFQATIDETTKNTSDVAAATEISASVSLDDEPANPGDNEETTAQIPAPANPAGTQADLLRYAGTVNEISDDIVDITGDFGQAAEKFRDKEITLSDFQSDFSEFAPKVKGLIGEIKHLSPPPVAKGIHQELTNGLTKCNKALDLMDNWSTTFDDNTKGAAVLLIAACISDVTAVEDELAELVSGN